MRWPKYWSFSYIIIPSKEIPGLISFRMDWLDLLQSKKYPGILVMNFSLDFIQLRVVPLNLAPEESHVIYYLLFIQSP